MMILEKFGLVAVVVFAVAVVVVDDGLRVLENVGSLPAYDSSLVSDIGPDFISPLLLVRKISFNKSYQFLGQLFYLVSIKSWRIIRALKDIAICLMEYNRSQSSPMLLTQQISKLKGVLHLPSHRR